MTPEKLNQIFINDGLNRLETSIMFGFGDNLDIDINHRTYSYDIGINTKTMEVNLKSLEKRKYIKLIRTYKKEGITRHIYRIKNFQN